MALNEKRIAEMESSLNDCGKAVEALSAVLEQMDALEGRMSSLFRYYGSADWYKDREEWDSTEKAALPEALTAGVLSEDAVYDLITEHGELVKRMRAIVTEAEKSHVTAAEK